MIKKNLIAVTTFSLLFGCGSSDDDTPDIPAEKIPSVAAPITVTFDTSLDSTSLEVGQISLTSTVTNKSIDGDLSYDEESRTVTFQPEHKLAINTEYEVTLNEGLTDLNGEVIDTRTWSYTTSNDYTFKLMNLAETCTTACDQELWLIAEGGEVREIANINLNGSSRPSVSDFQYKGLFYMSAEDDTHGREIWVTDGTESHTELFADLIDGPTGSWPGQFTVFGDYLYFVANNGTYSGTLWRTDGTAEGTVEVVNPRPNGHPNISSLRALNDKLIFTARGDNTGVELYVSDGTAEGTHMITDLNQGVSGSGASFLFELNDHLYFYGSDGNDTSDSNQHSYELFKTDGTAEGTVLVKDINPTDNASSDANIDYPTQLGNNYLFLANNGVNGNQLWKTDGTTNGTVLVKILNEGGSEIRAMEEYNGKIYIAEQNTGLWVSDGTSNGTKLVKAFDYALDLTSTDNGLIVSARLDSTEEHGYWLSDGTDAGTKFFHDRTGSNLWLETQIGNGTMFYENNGEGTFHYYTDGTAEGTKILETPNGLNLVYFER